MLTLTSSALTLQRNLTKAEPQSMLVTDALQPLSQRLSRNSLSTYFQMNELFYICH